MKKILLFLICLPFWVLANPDTLPPASQFWKGGIKVPFNKDSSHYLQVTLLNQTWVRWNESNTGTLFNTEAKPSTVDLGLRRTRMQLFAQISDWAFVYFQFGLNNFNRSFNSNNGNRKLASFFHDALCEITPFRRKNYLKIGGGLTIATGLSRFSQPSIGTIMTMDVPVFAQYTVDQTDEFARRLAIYARGQVWKIDYRFTAADPFPITSAGAAPPAISQYAQFTPVKHRWQYSGYLIFQFFDHEPHTTPYMTGTYLGKKKILNIAAGMVYQPKATWLQPLGTTDTLYQNMLHFCVESFVDMPVGNKDKGMAISGYVGYFNMNYGDNYLRYNGLMNPANGTNYTAQVTGAGATFGNAYPMFGTGSTLYAQAGFLLPKLDKKTGFRLMPYVSFTQSWFRRLGNLGVSVFQGGLHWHLSDMKARISLDYQNRPSFGQDTNGDIIKDRRCNQIILQFQIAI